MNYCIRYNHISVAENLSNISRLIIVRRVNFAIELNDNSIVKGRKTGRLNSTIQRTFNLNSHLKSCAIQLQNFYEHLVSEKGYIFCR
jgi:hypothetical protein